MSLQEKMEQLYKQRKQSNKRTILVTQVAFTTKEIQSIKKQGNVIVL